jgi:leucyl-tRNA synthetase
MLYFWQKEKKDEISCAIMKEVIEKFVILVSPFTPYVAEELWHVLGYKRWLIEQSWPKWDEEALREEFILVVIQINGKVRGRMQVPADISKEEVEKKAFTQERIRQFLAGKEKKQVIWIPKRLINIVV